MSRAGWALLVLAGCSRPNPGFLGYVGAATTGSTGADASSTAPGGSSTTRTGSTGGTGTGEAGSTGAQTASSGGARETTSSGSTGEGSTGAGTTGSTGEGTTGSTGQGSTGGSTGGGEMWVACPDAAELAACYHFPEGELAALVDGSVHDNNGTMVIKGLVPAPTGFGVAADIGPSSTIVVAEDGMTDSLDVSGAITMTALIELGMLPMIGRVGVIDKDGQYSIFISAGGGVRCQVAGFLEDSGVVVPVGKWTHVACSFDGQKIRVYLDGQLAKEIPKAGQLGGPNFGALALGGDSPPPKDRMTGRIDAVEIWSKALSQAEICARAGSLCP